ncbi:MAG: ribosome maturation factor RimM [Gammaproteobacteria bacterium]|nr:ribosome maturation factor RimM [Gammaproteobacteria bacterium]
MTSTETVSTETQYLVVGKIGAPYGVRGWLKLYSYTDPLDNLLDYDPWYTRPINNKAPATGDTGWDIAPVTEVKTHGKGLVAKFRGADDRDAAARLTGQEIAIRRDQLPPAAEGEYYWSDLQGLTVLTVEGIVLGVVDHLLETGANDVLVVKGDRERLIPYVLGPIVKAVDLHAGTLQVDWDPDCE